MTAVFLFPILTAGQTRHSPIKNALVEDPQRAVSTDTPPDYKALNSPMPPMRVVYPKKAVYTDRSFNNKANLFVVMFNPTCEHCEELTAHVRKDIKRFDKSQIVLMAAPGMGAYLEYFENNTKIGNTPQIHVGLDSSEFINKTFNYSGLPQVNIYNADRKLIRVFNGIETIDSLKPFIQ